MESLEEFLWEKISENSHSSLMKVTRSFMKNGEKHKKQYILTLLNVYVKHFLNINIWLLRKVYKILSNKKSKTIHESINELIYIFLEMRSESEKSSFTIPVLTLENKAKIIKMSSDETLSSRRCFNLEDDDDLKTLLNGNIYNLVSNILSCENSVKLVFNVLSYIFALKKKQIFFNDSCKDCDIYEIMFNLLLKSRPNMTIKTREYIEICYKLFQMNKKNQKLIYISFFVAIKNETTHHAYHILHDSDFLFTFHNIDPVTVGLIENEKRLRHNLMIEEKNLEVIDNSMDVSNEMFDIIKR